MELLSMSNVMLKRKVTPRLKPFVCVCPYNTCVLIATFANVLLPCVVLVWAVISREGKGLYH